jgi:hypothetical protein
LRSVCELKIVRKYSGSLPEVVVVLQIDETVDQLLLCFSSCFSFIHKVNDNMLIQSTVVGVGCSIELCSILNSVIINVKYLIFKPFPFHYLELINQIWIIIQFLNSILTKSNNSIWNSP